MNKKGAEKILSVYWFVILILVAGGVFAMVYLFYNHPYDIRDLEADILSNKIADCLSEKGYLKSKIFYQGSFSLSSENFLNKCNLNFESKEEEPQYYSEIQIYLFENLNNPILEILNGNKNLISSCEIQNENYQKLAKCSEKKFYTLDAENNQYLIKILSIVRKTEKNVK